MNKITKWILRIVPAVILLQTLFFKFTAAPEAVATFSALGVEPWGRIATGILELAAGVMLLVPAFTFYGALLAGVIMVGAIFSHLFFLGIAPGGDPTLFILALVVLAASAFLVRVEK